MKLENLRNFINFQVYLKDVERSSTYVGAMLQQLDEMGEAFK